MNSSQYTFYIGKTKKPFLVHAAAIADHSPALNALIYGPTLEANTKSVTLDDMAEADFIRFCQFAYAGDYNPPPPALVQAATISTGSEWANTNRRDDFMDSSVHSVLPCEELPEPTYCCEFNRNARNRRRKASFNNISFTPEQSRELFVDSCKPVPNRCMIEDYTPVFLAHARLYVFADKYGITTLKVLCLQKLHQTLVKFTLYTARIGDILELTRYAFSDDNTPDRKDVVDDLRRVVFKYMVSELDTIRKSEDFISLLEEGGPFARDLCVYLLNERDRKSVV